MAGYYTAARKLWNKPMPAYSKGSGIVFVNHVDVGNQSPQVVSTGSQVTTSWRTGRGYPTVEELQENEPTPTLLGDEFKYFGQLDRDADISAYHPYDRGHTFDTYKKTVEGVTIPHFGASFGSGTRFSGPLIPQSHSSVVATGEWYEIPAFTEINKYGPTAIARTTPTHPASTFGQGFDETSRDGLPDIHLKLLYWADRANFFRNLGKDYLNVQFGWKPFESDIKSTLAGLRNASRINAQLTRDSGRYVRRRFTFPLETTLLEDKTFSSGDLVNPGFMSTIDWNNLWGSPSTRTTRDIVIKTRKIWFSGAYTYFYQDTRGFTGALAEYERKANNILGIELTPELLWQIAPWSWAVDWFTNIGDMLRTASLFADNGLVLRWGYLMVDTIVDHAVTVAAAGTNPNQFGTAGVIYRSSRKERLRSTPYGFNISAGSLSNFQWSILAALGLSRAPHIFF